MDLPHTANNTLSVFLEPVEDIDFAWATPGHNQCFLDATDPMGDRQRIPFQNAQQSKMNHHGLFSVMASTKL
jgi:hypothetical protein